MEKFIGHLNDAEKTLQTAGHMLYVTFPLVKDKKLLLKIVLEIKKAVSNCIIAILHFEYLFKRISLYKDQKENFLVFEKKCSKRFGITDQELRLIKNLFEVVKKHNESPFEFIRGNRVVILSNDLNPETLNVEKTKEFLSMAKNVLKKTQETMKKHS